MKFHTFLRGAYRLLPVDLRTKIFNCRLIVKGSPFIAQPTYAEDGMISQHVVDFLSDPKFLQSYTEGANTGALLNHPGEIRFRAYIACWAAQQASNLIGDFVECGVGKGLLSKTIVEFLDFKDLERNFYLFDTYEGIPLELGISSEIDNIQVLNDSHYSKPYFEEVAKTFSMYPNVKLIKGKLPDSLELQPLLAIAYLSIDMNNAKSEIETISLLWNKIVIGGIVLLDDYAYGTEFLEQKRAWDSYAKEIKLNILTLPTGQGLIIKQ